MPTACVLLNTEIGAENEVLKEIKAIDGVEDAHILWGVYDIIAQVKAESMDELKLIIADRFGEISQIQSKLTMMTSKDPQFTVPQEKHQDQFSKTNLLSVYA
jgi:DNA-binding Lrp family transcriptional regulator